MTKRIPVEVTICADGICGSAMVDDTSIEGLFALYFHYGPGEGYSVQLVDRRDNRAMLIAHRAPTEDTEEDFRNYIVEKFKHDSSVVITMKSRDEIGGPTTLFIYTEKEGG